MTTIDEAPNPGSDAAVAKGCTCPVIDNHYGRGYMGREGLFAVHDNCPVHGGKPLASFVSREKVDGGARG